MVKRAKNPKHVKFSTIISSKISKIYWNFNNLFTLINDVLKFRAWKMKITCFIEQNLQAISKLFFWLKNYENVLEFLSRLYIIYSNNACRSFNTFEKSKNEKWKQWNIKNVKTSINKYCVDRKFSTTLENKLLSLYLSFYIALKLKIYETKRKKWTNSKIDWIYSHMLVLYNIYSLCYAQTIK